jgi:hypothetical protein
MRVLGRFVAAALPAWLSCSPPVHARPPASLGEPPTAPTPEDVARLPRLRIAKHGPTGPFTVNTARREEARNFFNTVYAASDGFAIGWTGNLATCTPGTTDAAFRDLVALRINYYRAMAGVPAAITFDPTFNTKDQAAALIMSANNALSHFPPTTWTCYSVDGYEAAGKSNIALGNAGPDAVTAFIEDSGNNNTAVGHRRWLLYPQTQLMGSGDVPQIGTNYAGNAIWVQDGHYFDARPATRDNFVSWPPPGFVPYPVVFARWSLAYPNADFSAATVTMSTNGVNIPVTLEQVANGYGENTLVWYPSGLNPSGPVNWPRPGTDTVYRITLQNVRGTGVPSSFSYQVTVFDPQVPGADTVLPVISGPDQPAVNQSNPYSFAAVTNATGYQWRRTQRAAFTAVEGAENGLTYFTTNTASDYNVIVTSPVASGTHAFHLQHTQPNDQVLSYTRVLVPSTNSQLQFKSRLGFAFSDEVAKVQISVDQGQSWQDVYIQAGTGTSGETSFSTRTISLAGFAAKAIQVRFSYNFSTGSYTYGSTAGWFIDDISFSNTEELTNPILTVVSSGTNFTFSPTQTGDYALDAHAQVYGQYYLEWGPIKRVTAVVGTTPTVQFSATPSVSGTQAQIVFSVSNYRSGMTFQLLQANDLTGNWATNSSASFQTVVSNSTFRFTAPTGGASKMFYRIQSN